MILITGAGRGIGKYLFDRFRHEGYVVSGTYHLSPVPLGHLAFKVDITKSSEIEMWLSMINDYLKKVVLINCAGINYTSFAHKADLDKWIDVIKVNLIGTFNVIHAVLPIMRKEGYGRIVNLSSVVSKRPVPGASAYAASKAGLLGMIKSLSAENASKGITINNLNLGYFNIGMINEVTDEYQEKLMNEIPAHSFGNPEEILRIIMTLIDTPYINGASIDMNGGLY